MQYHADRNPGNEKWANDKFKEINDAFSVLGDPEKRERSDRFRTAEGINIGDVFSGRFTRGPLPPGQGKGREGKTKFRQLPLCLHHPSDVTDHANRANVFPIIISHRHSIHVDFNQSAVLLNHLV